MLLLYSPDFIVHQALDSDDVELSSEQKSTMGQVHRDRTATTDWAKQHG